MVLLRISGNPVAEIANCILQEIEAEILTYLQAARVRLQKARFRTLFLIFYLCLLEGRRLLRGGRVPLSCKLLPKRGDVI